MSALIQTIDVDIVNYSDLLDFIDFRIPEFRELLKLMDKVGASDAYISSGKKIDLKINKEVYSVSSNIVELDCMELLITDIYRGDTLLSIKEGVAFDTSYLMNYDVPRELSFRIHISSTGCGTGLLMVLRRIPGTPPNYKELDIPKELIEVELAINKGIGFICGETNSGKSTTVASINREVLVNNRINILTYEYPIEYTFDSVENKLGRIDQFQIGGDIKTYAEAARNCLRCSPDRIFIGETRDKETCTALLLNAETGHNIITTMHVGRVHLILDRIALFYPVDHYSNIISSVIEQLNFIVIQQLVKATDGGLIAVREILILNNDLKRKLHECEVKNVTNKLEQLVVEYGTPLYKDSLRLYELGKISKDVHNNICTSIGEGTHAVS